MEMASEIKIVSSIFSRKKIIKNIVFFYLLILKNKNNYKISILYLKIKKNIHALRIHAVIIHIDIIKF